MPNFRGSLFFACLLLAVPVHAQELHISRDIAWEVIPFAGEKAYSCANCDFSPERGQIPRYTEQIALPDDGRLLMQMTDAAYEAVEAPEWLSPRHQIGEQVNWDYHLQYAQKAPYAVFSCIPFRKNPENGQFEKLVRFELSIEVLAGTSPREAHRTSRDYASNSVLSSGNWYKISADSSGIYKMDKAFLDELGLDVDNLDPRNIRVYGNGGGMLPEPNATPRHDDLVENAIRVVGESNGSLDDNDYVLFYAEGPDRWVFNESNQSFAYEKNIYSTQNYYFVTASKGPGKRISARSSSGSSNMSTSTFDALGHHEDDQANLLQSGRKWFGEYFDNVLSYDFVFSFPNRTDPVSVETEVAARSTSSSSSYNVSGNGQALHTHTLGSVPVSSLALYASVDKQTTTFNPGSDAVNIRISFNKPNAAAVGWLNYISLRTRRQLTMTGNQMIFRDAQTVGAGNNTTFSLSNAGGVTIWEVTDPMNIRRQQHSNGTFNLPTEELRTFVAYRGSNFPAPGAEGEVPNQNLHAIGQPELVIVSHPRFVAQANALKNFHEQHSGLYSVLVTTDQVYNEFSSGRPDLCAVRDMMKMLYDRAGNDPEKLPRYLILFGNSTYDFRNIEYDPLSNTNFVLTYQSRNSTHPISTFATDDFFGFLDDDEGDNILGNAEMLDVGIGRLPVKTEAEAESMVKKIKHYASTKTFGPWRTNMTFIADDGDNNIHINQADELAENIRDNFNTYNVNKIYFDAFEKVSTSGGKRYPDVKRGINNSIFKGTLIMNYTGHGGINGWAHERVLGIQDIRGWENWDNLPLFVTATCEFSRFDDPAQSSAGELIIISDQGGGIALFTTVRVVFANQNQAMARSFYESVFEPEDGEMPRLGDILRKAKNNTATGLGNRKFLLLGDPVLRLAYPEEKVITTRINDIVDVHNQADTLQALAKVKIQGRVHKQSGGLLKDFNGIVYPTVFDKPREIRTLANDDDSQIRTFELQQNVVYRGKASVKEGLFSFEFIVPKDIAYRFGFGRISYYADDGSRDAAGAFENVIIGGLAEDYEEDNKGPRIDIFMNDENFVFGGITDESPLMIVKLEDESGINTVGSGIGHDITGVRNEETQDAIILNDFYEAELDNFRKGEVRYPLSDLEEGRHKMEVKAWDVHNNSGAGYTEFVVASSAELALAHVLNYPNPFTTRTAFQFEHNRPGDILEVRIQIFTVSGKLVKTITRQLLSTGYRVADIEWNGLDDFGDKIGRGVYIYRLQVRASDGALADEYQKLVILR